MSQSQNLVESSSKKGSMDNFLHFFNLKMFRYSLLKQLKAVSSYVFVILLLVATFGCLIVLLTMKNEGNTEKAQNNVIIFKYVFFMVYFPFFTMLIAFKSVQMVRDEIEDGTLLIFNSMPYTRTRMIIEKWFSVQIVCLFYSIIVLLFPTLIGYLVAKIMGGTDSVLNFKILFSLINTMFLTSFIIQLLLSTFAILLSVAISSKATTGLISMFGALTFVGPVLVTILTSIYNPTNAIYTNINYYEKAIRESGLKKYLDDPETKNYFEFDEWGVNTESINVIQGKNLTFSAFFQVTSNNDLKPVINDFKTNKSNEEAEKKLNHYKNEGIKIDGNFLPIKTDTDMPNAEKIYHEINWDKSSPLYLTSYVKENYENTALFRKESKLEEIRKILDSDYFSFGFSSKEREHAFKIDPSNVDIIRNDTPNLIVDGLENMIKNDIIGKNNKKDGFVALNGLYINNPQYYAFVNFVHKLKNIATSFRIVSRNNSDNHSSNLAELNERLDAINKYNKAFKLNNYLNWWTQWYMMWHGDLRPKSDGQLASALLVPNSTAKFVISDKTRTYIKDERPGSGPALNRKEIKENYITADYSSVKPIVNMAGLYSTYICLSLILAAVTIYVVIRKDFV